jgi:hypothetical protein
MERIKQLYMRERIHNYTRVHVYTIIRACTYTPLYMRARVHNYTCIHVYTIILLKIALQ